MNEYEVIAVFTDNQHIDHNTDLCKNCIFSMEDDIFCMNMKTNPDQPSLNDYAVYLPDCFPTNFENPSVIYAVAHKASGKVLTSEDTIELVRHYKGVSQ